MSACGGGGGGGGDDDDSDSSGGSSNPTLKDIQVPFSSTVLDHFQDEIITIKNDRTASISIGQVAQANPLDAPFSMLNDKCSGRNLAPSATCTLQVRFLPTSQGTFSDSFEIPSGTGKTIMTVSVDGDGRAFSVLINQIDTIGCPTVKLYVSVADKNDNPVTVLTKDEFSIFENNVLQVIDSFNNSLTTPISVMLVLDYSFSIQNFIPDVEAAAKSLIDQLDLNNNTDEAAMMKFAEQIELKQAFTDDKNSLLLAIEDPYTGLPYGTVLYDALYQAVDETAVVSRNRRRAVVVLTDGEDTKSVDHNVTEVIDHALEEGVPIFTIGLGNVFFENLQQIADETGGQYFLAPTSGDLEDIYEQIAAILSQQYIIEYQSPSSGGAIITLDVEVDAKDGSQGEGSRDVPGC